MEGSGLGWFSRAVVVALAVVAASSAVPASRIHVDKDDALAERAAGLAEAATEEFGAILERQRVAQAAPQPDKPTTTKRDDTAAPSALSWLRRSSQQFQVLMGMLAGGTMRPQPWDPVADAEKKAGATRPITSKAQSEPPSPPPSAEQASPPGPPPAAVPEVTKAKAADDARKALDAKKAADAKAAEEARKAADAKKIADAKAAAEVKAAEVKAAEEARKAADAKKIADAKASAEVKAAEDARKAAEAKAAEEARKAADAKKTADAKAAVDAEKAAQVKQAEEAKQAAEVKKLAAQKKREAENGAKQAATEGKRLADAQAARPAPSADKRGAPNSACPHAGSGVTLPGWYMVQSGDTLTGISLRHYGSALRYEVIHAANRTRIVNTNKIYACQRIYLPHLRR
jgi:hypothetical protein